MVVHTLNGLMGWVLISVLYLLNKHAMNVTHDAYQPTDLCDPLLLHF